MGDLFLSRFTPSMMSADVLEKIFVQRGDMAHRIVDVLRESILTPSKHHTLVIGSRGIGKTHLLSLIQNRIAEQADLANRVRIAWLREEEWGVASFLDFLYRILRALAVRYDDEKLREQTEQLFSIPLKTAERRAADLLREFTGAKTLLLIAENLDSVFAGLGKKGQQRLRAFLQEESSWTILGSSQALFGGVTLYESPFYGFFDIHHLQELTVDDAARLVRNIAELANDAELAAYVLSEAGRARIRAVHHLAGGNHRVYMILSEFLTRDSLDQLVEPFLHMMDDLTPYYQARMEQLSPQQRKIIDLLCSLRGAVPVKEIAKRCFISSQTASSQLKDLRERGYVESTPVGRDAYYELAEPLMRLALEVKNQRNGHVRLFLDFLRHWYARTELVDLLARTPISSVLEREYIQLVLAFDDESTDDSQFRHLIRRYLDLTEVGNWSQAVPIAEKLVQQRGGAWDWTLLGQCHANLKAFPEALSVFDRALEIDDTLTHAWTGRAIALFAAGRESEALEALSVGISHDANDPSMHVIRAVFLQKLGRTEEALDATDGVVLLSPHTPGTWQQRGEILAALGRDKEAVEAFQQAFTLGARSRDLRLQLSSVLSRIERFSDAMEVLTDMQEAEWDPHTFTGRIIALSGMGEYSRALAEATSEHIDQWLKSSVPEDVQMSMAAILLLDLYFVDSSDVERSHHASTLYQCFKENNVSSTLGAALFRAAESSLTPTTPTAQIQEWIGLWKAVTEDDEGFSLPLRLLSVFLKYRQTENPRVLLELAAEERRIVLRLVLADFQRTS